MKIDIQFTLLGRAFRVYQAGYSKWRTYKDKVNGISLIQTGRTVFLMVK